MRARFGADAVVGAVAAEAQVWVGVAQNVELEWPVEHGVVVIGRAVEQAGALALADGDTTEFGVRQRRSLEAVHRRGPADDFVGGGVGPLTLEQFPLIRVLEKTRSYRASSHCGWSRCPRRASRITKKANSTVVDGFAIDIGPRSGG